MLDESILAFDTETHLIAESHIAPPIVCCSVHCDGETLLASKADPDAFLEDVVDLVIAHEGTIVAHNLAFDLAVFAHNYPDKLPAIYEGLLAGKYQDTLMREKLLCLADTGDLSFLELPNGAKKKLIFSLSGLVMEYFGVDISAGKSGEDAWRRNYKELEDIPTDEWPGEAVDYAKEDSVWAARLYDAQEERRAELTERLGLDPLAVAPFRAAVSFSLFMVSCRGMKVDPAAKAEIEKMLAEELAPEKMKLLISKGILEPAQPGRPYANGAVDAEGNPKLTKPIKEKINSKAWKGYCIDLAGVHGWEVPLTPPSDKYPDGQPSITMDWLDEREGTDDLLDEYLHRQRLQKLVTTEMPRLNREDGSPAEVVHPMFDALKETGRTSSYASKGWPSLNGQNVDPRARPCLVPREGFVFVSIDYNQMELGTAAQTCLDLFGYSVMADKINAGQDLHAYLGAQMAASFDDAFKATLDDAGVKHDDEEQVYKLFLACKDHSDKDIADFFDEYRNFAKPTDLGFPGGLGPDTFVAYAKKTYGIEITVEQATEFRDVWRKTFPEMVEYHNWINKECLDPFNSHGDDRRYSYTSPMGMYRAGCFFCAAANGKALQTPSAEGALAGLVNIVQSCYDKTHELAELLNGHVFPVNFVHDENIFEIREDDLLTRRIDKLKESMVDWMQTVTPDVKAGAEAAVMRRWHKKAKPVFDENNNYIPWEPKQ